MALKDNIFMKIQCKVVNDNSNLIKLSIVDDDNNLIFKIDCQQVNLCEKLPSLIYTLEENITTQRLYALMSLIVKTNSLS